ncbi:MAG: 30S ribosomal protein S9 [Candidatus Omnitrophota bacterium]
MTEGKFQATGRRKTSVARVFLITGQGKIEINGRTLENYFHTAGLRTRVLQPLNATQTAKQFDVSVNVCGGGETGQAEAIRLGISRALVKANDSLRLALKGAGFLSRDPRMKERKKYGQKGARRRFQWTKR